MYKVEFLLRSVPGEQKKFGVSVSLLQHIIVCQTRETQQTRTPTLTSVIYR